MPDTTTTVSSVGHGKKNAVGNCTAVSEVSGVAGQCSAGGAYLGEKSALLGEGPGDDGPDDGAHDGGRHHKHKSLVNIHPDEV